MANNIHKIAEEAINDAFDALEEEYSPTDAKKWAYAKAQAKKKFKTYPSAYANLWASKKYKKLGGGWRKK